MSPKIKNYLIALFAAAALCSGLIAWNLSKRISDLETALASARQETRSTPKIATPSAPRSGGATQDPAESAKPKTAALDLPVPEPGEEPPPVRSRGNRGNLAALMANPEFTKAMNLQQRAALDARYAELFKRLNLSPDALERFKDLLVERQSARMDVMAAARENGLDPRENRDEIQRLTDQAQADVDANIKAALGDAAYDQYKSYETTQPQRTVVTSLDQRLAYSGTPLNRAQSDFLIQALSPSDSSGSATPSGPGGFGPWNGGGGRTALITDEVLQKAQTVLTADQLSVLKQLKVEQDAQTKLRELFRNGGGRPAN